MTFPAREASLKQFFASEYVLGQGGVRLNRVLWRPFCLEKTTTSKEATLCEGMRTQLAILLGACNWQVFLVT